MTEEELVNEAKRLSRWQQHKFMVLVALTIVISLLLVVVALGLYNSSGAAQLDLSRPGYQSVRNQADNSDDFPGFSASGALDKKALDEFRELYDEQLKEAAAIDGFGGDVMSDAALGIDAPQPQQEQDSAQ